MKDSPVELVCREVVELVNEYLGHALSPEDHAAFDAHLAGCPPCTAYLEQMKTVIAMAGSLGAPRPAPEVEGELMDLFRRWSKKPS
jgi:predicted anti-sigma-YlaC factor YlaD